MRIVGVDLGTRKISLSFLDNGLPVDAKTIEVQAGMTRGEQLSELCESASAWLVAFNPSWVWIEAVIVGNNRKYSIGLAEVNGALQMSMSYVKSYGIGTVDNKRWKSEIVGNGNASKEQIAAWLRERYPGFQNLWKNQDEIDATCIALYGDDIVRRADGFRLD